MNWQKTYDIETPPEPAMRWEDYERLVTANWSSLLNAKPSPPEKRVQGFFEQHPSMVPGAFNLIGNESGHFPWLCSLISQPPLPSYDRRIPDFMWLSMNSDTYEPVLVEIEAPGRRWFTKEGRQTAELTKALNQITEWKAWFGVPRNVEAFKAFYGLNRKEWHGRRFRPSYLLIYGRRAEANATAESTQKRGYLHADDIVTMTYDRLQPNPKAGQALCIKSDATGALRAISVPPTLKWIPGLAEERSMLRDLDVAIQANHYISPDRRAFLVRRLQYWNHWVKNQQRGVINSSDQE